VFRMVSHYNQLIFATSINILETGERERESGEVVRDTTMGGGGNSSIGCIKIQFIRKREQFLSPIQR
jgi:hypothetical protein